MSIVQKVTGNGTLMKVAVALLCAGVIGGIGNFAQVAAIKATVESIDKRMDREAAEFRARMDRIEKKVDDYILRPK